MSKAAQAAVEKGITPETDTEETVAEVETHELTQEEWLNERVPFYAVYDGEKYKDDIVVTINGRNTVIKRGEQVMIPRYVHMAILDAERQKVAAHRTSEGFEAKFKENQSANMM